MKTTPEEKLKECKVGQINPKIYKMLGVECPPGQKIDALETLVEKHQILIDSLFGFKSALKSGKDTLTDTELFNITMPLSRAIAAHKSISNELFNIIGSMKNANSR